MDGDLFLFVGNIMALNVFLVQILLLCSFGQRVYSQNELLSCRLYESKWPDIIKRKESGKIVHIFMTALNRDCVVIIGKLLPLILTTFASVILNMLFRLI